VLKKLFKSSNGTFAVANGKGQRVSLCAISLAVTLAGGCTSRQGKPECAACPQETAVVVLV